MVVGARRLTTGDGSRYLLLRSHNFLATFGLISSPFTQHPISSTLQPSISVDQPQTKAPQMTLEATEAECAKVATAPRVSLSDIENAIDCRYDITGTDAIGPNRPTVPELDILSICILVLRNGFTIIGKAAPASAANFDRELGIKLAYEDAVRQVWPLMGYSLRDRLMSSQ